MAENDGNQSSKAVWLHEMNHEFLIWLASHIMEYRSTQINHRIFRAWAKDFKVRWPNIAELTPKQMRGKRECFKKQFDSWNALTRLTGFGWDPVTGRPKITDATLPANTCLGKEKAYICMAMRT